MSPTTFQRQSPRTKDDETEPEAKENGAGELQAEDEEPSTSPTLEGIIEEMIESRTEGLREELDELERQIETVDNFARISLNERKVKQNEVKLSEFSGSLTAFAEKAFENLNDLENRLDTQALLLAAILESLDDVDLSEVHRHRSEQLVMDATPEERLASVIDSPDDTQ